MLSCHDLIILISSVENGAVFVLIFDNIKVRCMVCADLKGFLTDVKPQLQTMIDTEIEKNPYEVLSCDNISCGSFRTELPALLNLSLTWYGTCLGSGRDLLLLRKELYEQSMLELLLVALMVYLVKILVEN